MKQLDSVASEARMDTYIVLIVKLCGSDLFRGFFLAVVVTYRAM